MIDLIRCCENICFCVYTENLFQTRGTFKSSLVPKSDSGGTKNWKSMNELCGVLGSVLLNEKNQEVRYEKPLKN